jgi:hypothetical protein
MGGRVALDGLEEVVLPLAVDLVFVGYFQVFLHDLIRPADLS